MSGAHLTPPTEDHVGLQVQLGQVGQVPDRRRDGALDLVPARVQGGQVDEVSDRPRYPDGVGKLPWTSNTRQAVLLSDLGA